MVLVEFCDIWSWYKLEFGWVGCLVCLYRFSGSGSLVLILVFVCLFLNLVVLMLV